MSGPSLIPDLSSALGTRSSLEAQAQTFARQLQVGMQVELAPTRVLGREMIETQVRILGESKAWVSGVQARLTGSLAPGPLTQPATPLRAEVLATSPMLSLRLLPQTAPAILDPNQAAPTDSRTWLGQQFRQLWPAAQPLAPTLARIAAQSLAEGMGDGADATTSLYTDSPARTNQARAPQVQQALMRLFDQLTTVAELTNPERLARAVERSGLWLEARLVQAARDPAQADGLQSDLKAQLLALAQLLRSAGGRTAAAQPQTAPPSAGPTNLDVALMQPAPQISASALAELNASLALDGVPVSDDGPSPAADGSPKQEDTQTHSRSAPESAPLDDGQALDPSSTADTAPLDPSPLDETGGSQQRLDQEGPRLGHLEREVEGMIKQVVTRQLQSLDSPAGQVQWLLELPFKTPSGVLALEAHIQRDQAPQRGDHESWSIELRLDLPRLGPLRIRLMLCEARLNGCLQAADPEGAEVILGHLDELRARLEARDIVVAALYAGQRPIEPPPPICQTALLSEQA